MNYEPPANSYLFGGWGGSGPPLTIYNPADGTVAGVIATVDDQDIDAALDAASKALGKWRRTDPWQRSSQLRAMAGYLRSRQSEIAAAVTVEQGKPLSQAEGEVAASADHFDWCADEARRIYGRTIPARDPGRRILVQREPVGVVGAFSASNFPCLLPARKIAAALAAGCTVVAKPAEEAPTAALWIGRAADEAGLPNGVLSILVGDPQDISSRVLAHSKVRKITLTGSVPLGRQIMEQAAKGLKSVSLELGGHAPVVVLDDVDPERAGRDCANGKFRNAGQVCISPSRFLVPTSIHDTFVTSFVDTTKALTIGPGADSSCDLGPLQNERRVDAMEDLVATATREGATLMAGGQRLTLADGWWYEPTVLTGVARDAEVMLTEPFGPIAPVHAYDDLADAIEIANSTDFGLAGFVLGESLQTCLEVADQLEVGMVGINDFSIALAEAPFGGIKHSGFGREGGSEGIAEFTVAKYINVAPA